MSYKCETRNAHLAIALLSIFISMAVIVCVDRLPQQPKQDQLFVNHICLLQLIASILLFVGSIKRKQWYFVPWLAIAALFAYTLIYKSIDYMLHPWNDVRVALEIICLLYIISGFWLYFIYAVYKDFQDMCDETRVAQSSMKGYNQYFEI